MIKISILHPSFDRAQMAYATFQNWMSNAKNPQEIEYIIGLDNNDPSLLSYQNKFTDVKKIVGNFSINEGESTCAVQALNRIASKISDTSELLVEVCDDIDSVFCWDIVLLDLIKDVDNFNDPKMIGTHDGLRDYGIVFTQPIMNRAAYNRLGFMIYPEYTSMFADNDFTEVARRTGWIINAPQILFKHKHYSIGLNKIDNTYTKRNNNEETNKNHKIYQERWKRNFDL